MAENLRKTFPSLNSQKMKGLVCYEWYYENVYWRQLLEVLLLIKISNRS